MNSEAKHTSEARFTPGPWGCREPNGSGMGWKIGPAWLGEKPGTEETKANARLVAAAPDLFSALLGVLRVADRQTDEFDAARAAIAKATGESV